MIQLYHTSVAIVLQWCYSNFSLVLDVIESSLDVLVNALPPNCLLSDSIRQNSHPPLTGEYIITTGAVFNSVKQCSAVFSSVRQC
jgi:hypothetical protein